METLLENPNGAISLAFSLSGLILFLLALFYYGQAKKSSQWPFTSGTILSSEIMEVGNPEVDHGAGKSYTPALRFSYQINGRDYVSTKLRIFPLFSTDRASLAFKLAARYPKNSSVSVYYDPENPQNSVLEPGVTNDIFWLMCIGILIFVAALVAVGHFGLRGFLLP